MITIAKIKIYEYYKGYYDGFYIQNQLQLGLVISDKEWMLLRDLIHEIYLAKSKLASKEFVDRLEIKLVLNCENKETVDYLKNVKNW